MICGAASFTAPQPLLHPPEGAAVEDAASAHQPITSLPGEGATIMSRLFRSHAEWLIEEGAA